MRQNQDLTRMIATYGGILVLSIVIIIFVYNVVQGELYSDVDRASGETVLDYQGAENTGVDFIGVKTIQENGFSGETYDKLCNRIEKYAKISNPELKSISYVKDSLKKDGNKFDFRIKTDNGAEYKIQAEDAKNGQFKLTISNKKGELYTYDSTKFKTPKNNKTTLAENFLPYSTQLPNGKAVVLRYTLNGEYEIQVDSCGYEDIKHQAKSAITEWLKSINYDPDDFNFIIPEYCEG